MSANPHKSFIRLGERRSREAQKVFRLASQLYRDARKFEQEGYKKKATMFYKKADRLLVKAGKSGALLGPEKSQRNPIPEIEIYEVKDYSKSPPAPLGLFSYRAGQRMFGTRRWTLIVTGRDVHKVQAVRRYDLERDVTVDAEGRKINANSVKPKHLKRRARDVYYSFHGRGSRLYVGLYRKLAALERAPDTPKNRAAIERTKGMLARAGQAIERWETAKAYPKKLPNPNTNGIIETAAGLQALEYLGGKVKPGPKPRYANPTYYYDEDFDDTLDEGAELGSRMARALGHTERERRARPRPFLVSYYSPTRDKRVEFMRPIIAHSAAEAKRQAKAMVTNEKKPANFVAREMNPQIKTKASAVCYGCGKVVRRGSQAVSTYHERFGAKVFHPKCYAKAEREAANPEEHWTVALRQIAGDTTKVRLLAKGLLARDRTEYDRLTTVRSLGIEDGTPEGYRAYQGAGHLLAGTVGLLAEKSRKDVNRWVSLVRRTKQVKRESVVGPTENPTAREMSERFNGHASGQVRQLKISEHALSRDMSRAGKLVFLKLKAQSKQLRIPGAMVCIDPKTERLWIAGDRTPLLNQRAKPGEMLDFGEIDQICYETTKRHVGDGRRSEYVHTFGEDGGRKPRLRIDSEGMPVIAGGGYKIDTRGIVN